MKSVFAYGRKGMVTYSLDNETGVVTVDQTRGEQTLDYGGHEGELRGAKNNNWQEACQAALKRLRADGWPLDSRK